jgi:hypothetical protein
MHGEVDGYGNGRRQKKRIDFTRPFVLSDTGNF